MSVTNPAQLGATAAQAAHPRIRQRRAEVEADQLRRRSRRFLVMAALVAVGLVCFGASQSPLLDVNEVRVVGSRSASPDQVRAVAGIALGEPLVSLDLDTARARVVQLPAVSSVAVTRSWRGVVTVEVIERQRAGVVDTGQGRFVVSADGLVVEAVDVGDQATALPLISGAVFSTGVGERVPAELTDAIAVAAAVPPDILPVLDRIKVSSTGVSLGLVGGALGEIGDSRMIEEKFEVLRTFVAQVDLSCLATLDLRAPTAPVLTRSEPC